MVCGDGGGRGVEVVFDFLVFQFAKQSRKCFTDQSSYLVPFFFISG